MSLGDQLRVLRAMRGGPSLTEVCTAVGETSARKLQEIEQRYRDPSDEAFVDKLAAYYNVPVSELRWHRARPRKALALHITAAMQANWNVTLRLRSGETLVGRPLWWDLGAIGLDIQEGGPPIVVQRHAVIDWDESAESTPPAPPPDPQ